MSRLRVRSPDPLRDRLRVLVELLSSSASSLESLPRSEDVALPVSSPSLVTRRRVRVRVRLRVCSSPSPLSSLLRLLRLLDWSRPLLLRLSPSSERLLRLGLSAFSERLDLLFLSLSRESLDCSPRRRERDCLPVRALGGEGTFFFSSRGGRSNSSSSSGEVEKTSWISSSMSSSRRIISRRGSSFHTAKVMATPSAPARPVRPMRCRYIFSSSGQS